MKNTNQRKNFSRYNQPKVCRLCGKLTTYSEVSGHHGLDLCRVCFDEATLENEHFDGHHEDEPKAGCVHCQKPEAR
jgi:ribosomal protein S14